MPSLKKAIDALQSIFDRFSFDLNAFLKKHKFNKDQSVRFVSYVSYELFYNEIALSSFRSETIELTLLILSSEAMEENETRKIVFSLPIPKKLQLISFCFQNLREGSFSILNMLENSSSLSSLIKNLRNKYFDDSLLSEILLKNSKPSVKFLENELEKNAEAQIKEFSALLPKIIDLMITFPTRGFDEIEIWKKKMLISSPPQADIDAKRAFALQAQNELKQLFEPFYKKTYSFLDLRSFFQTFGLKDHSITIPGVFDVHPSLVHQIKKLIEIFHNPVPIRANVLQGYVFFILSLCQELHAFQRPSQYISGLNRIAFAVSTRGNNFPKMPWLPSVLKGLDAISKLLKKNGVKWSLKQQPVFVFDQSPPKQFTTNAKYINALAKKYKANIWHISRAQALKLAQKLNVESWIRTNPKGDFGYAGSRNCLFFLAPVLHAAAQQNNVSINAVLSLSNKILQSFFDSAVLGKNGRDTILHFGEDDVYIPTCNIFSDALFAEYHQEIYFSRITNCFGRARQVIFAPLDAKIISTKPSTAFYSTLWSPIPESGGMKGLLTKPRFCLPIHFGNEEWHTKPPVCVSDPFQQPILHLGGTRYPSKLLPQSPLDGIESYLRFYLPYSMQISISSCLIDSQNTYRRSILPWLKPEIISTFRCMNDLWIYSQSPEAKSKMLKAFWNNLYDLFSDIQLNNMPLKSDILALTHIEFETDVPKKLKQFYEKIQKDAMLFFTFGKVLVDLHRKGNPNPLLNAKDKIEQKSILKIKDTHFTKDLYILIDKITEFCTFN